MDGDDLDESEPSENKNLTEIFTDIFPYYLAIGMTYDEFWHGPVSLARAYRKAWDIKMHKEEQDRWRQGLYFYESLLKIAPVLHAFAKDAKPGEYPSEPYPLTDKEAKDRERKKEMENFKAYLAKMEADSERNLKLRKEKEVGVDG